MGGVCFQFGAHAQYSVVHGSGNHGLIIAPDFLENFIDADSPACGSHQIGQQVSFIGGERALNAISGEGAVREIHFTCFQGDLFAHGRSCTA